MLVQDENEFFAAENGHIRPSDRGESRTTFRDAEEVAFGERAERPPDLQQFTAKFKAAKSKAGQDAHSQLKAQSMVAKDQGDSEQDSGAEEQSEEEEVQLSKNQRRKKRKAESLAHRSDMDGDDGLEGGLRGSADTALLQRALSVKKPAGGGGGKSRPPSAGMATSGRSSAAAGGSGSAVAGAGPVGVKAQNEMDALRLKVQAAYRQLRDKRNERG